MGKTVKKLISAILGLIFVLIVIVGIYVCTYIFSKPSHLKGTDSRQIIKGYWTDEVNDLRFEFDKSGEFKITKESGTNHLYAKGYFKIDNKKKKIKLLVLPKGRDKDLDLGEKLGFFSTITYTRLDAPPESDKAVAFQTNSEKTEEYPATINFIITGGSFNNGTVDLFQAKRTTTVTDFYDGK